MLTKEEVGHIAYLARLEISEIEKESFAGELNSIFNYIEKLKELDAGNIEATFQVFPQDNRFRDDEAQESLNINEVLANSPEKEDNYFKMPKIIE
ncbi:MAG: Asp-tRNA(Asn)/Glu-tRNA(Gln) amidotransferase subunit GatC [Armatimonadetes bacterium]|nr:Asp-tRNA(Asn)/Glu-tRNA(Gln) amidotransferase subunit GatC [Armatimonadota bacterium]